MSKAPGFGDLAAERLKRESELDRIAALLNWGPLSRRLERHCRKQDGRPPFPPMVMFRALLLAQWYGLSDRDLEEALCDRLSFRRFIGLGLEQATPDHTTVCRFRERLNEAGLTIELLTLVNAQLDAKGLMLKRGTLIDATIVETAAAKPAPSDDPAERVDPDAAFLKREGKAGTSYGYKGHVAVDEGSLLVRTAKLTPANVAETVVADELILANRDCKTIYADKAYDTHARRSLLATLGLKDGIMHRPSKHHALTIRCSPRSDAASRPSLLSSSRPTAFGERAISASSVTSSSSPCSPSASICVACWRSPRLPGVRLLHDTTPENLGPTAKVTPLPPNPANPIRLLAPSPTFCNSPRWGEVGEQQLAASRVRGCRLS